MHVLKKETRNTKYLAFLSSVCPSFEYGSACCDLCRGQINALAQVQQKAAQFTIHMKDCDWETLAERRAIARLCALFKAYCGERAWEAICDRVRGPHCLSRVDHVRKIRVRKQRTDIGNYSFINRTIKNCNQIPAEALGFSFVNLRFLETGLGKQL